MSTHGDGGKGSARRQEDVSKINENWDRIFGAKAPMSSPTAAGLTKEQTKMELDDDDECFGTEDDDEEQDCSWCGGCGEGDYDGASCRKCHGTGIEPRDDNHDDI
jgi:hypothetical protein